MRGTGAIAIVASLGLAGCGLSTFGLMEADGGMGSPDASAKTSASLDATVPGSGDGSLPADGGVTAIDGAATAEDAAGSTDAAAGSDASDAACPPPSSDASVSTATYVSPPPTIDGNLNDWGCGPWTDLNDKNAAYVSETGQKISGQYAVRWDENNVYVAAQIVVPKLQGSNPTDLYYNDALEIFLSGDSPLTGQYDPQSHQYIVDWNDNAADYGPLNYSPASNAATASPPNLIWKALAVTGGWQVEVAVGWRALLSTGTGLSSGASLSFDVAFDDGNGTMQKTYLVAMMSTHAIPPQCSCPTCCCGWVSPTPDLPNCDTLCFGGLTLE